MDNATHNFESDQTETSKAHASTCVHRIDIEPITPIGPSSLKGENRPQKYRVTYRGATLIESTKEPVYSSCRALVARGLTGRLEVWGAESYARGIVRDIEKGAKLTIIENEKLGPKLARYQPRPDLAGRAINRKGIAAIACLEKPATDEAAGRVA